MKTELELTSQRNEESKSDDSDEIEQHIKRLESAGDDEETDGEERQEDLAPPPNSFEPIMDTENTMDMSIEQDLDAPP